MKSNIDQLVQIKEELDNEFESYVFEPEKIRKMQCCYRKQLHWSKSAKKIKKMLKNLKGPLKFWKEKEN